MKQALIGHHVVAANELRERRLAEIEGRLREAIERRATAMQMAANAYDDLLDAMRAARDSGVAWDVIAADIGVNLMPVSADRDISGFSPQPNAYPVVEPLTERERDVLRYLATYLPFEQIGTALFISSNTVKTHVRCIYRKLGVQSRADAVERALSAGLLAYGAPEESSRSA